MNEETHKDESSVLVTYRQVCQGHVELPQKFGVTLQLAHHPVPEVNGPLLILFTLPFLLRLPVPLLLQFGLIDDYNVYIKQVNGLTSTFDNTNDCL